MHAPTLAKVGAGTVSGIARCHEPPSSAQSGHGSYQTSANAETSSASRAATPSPAARHASRAAASFHPSNGSKFVSHRAFHAAPAWVS
ncbi:hypothetical protein SAMN05880568_0005 [Microbacterium sp. RURRCA19A]|nr:hypothetical protein SAMN05880568_0005 [Microbacterium sp. RURRCA19A]